MIMWMEKKKRLLLGVSVTWGVNASGLLDRGAGA